MRRTALMVLILLALPAVAQGTLRVRIQPDRVTCRPGTQCAMNAYAEGGQQPYTYTWYVGNEATGVVNQSKVWTFNNPGRYTVRVVARDRAGNAAEALSEVEVTAPQIRIERRGTLNFSATPQGLTPPYQFRIFQDGQQLGNPIPTTSDHLDFSVNTGAAGTHEVKVLVIDGNRLEVWAALRYDQDGGFVSNPPPPPPGSQSSGSGVLDL